MPTSLVTGGAGFIGSHVAKHCLALGHDVVVLDDLSGGFEDNVPAGADFCRGSITDVRVIQELFAEHKFDYVYHLAAYAAEGLSHFIRRYNYENNVLGTINLVNAAVNAETVKRFVFTSSIAVYGAAQNPMTESTTPMPEDPYGVAKYACEMDLRAAHEMFGLNYTDLPPAQRLWRTPEHRRPLSQRDRHFHEPDHAGPAHDDLRRRAANEGLYPRGRRGPA